MFTVFLLGILLESGCVTQTERVPYRPYAVPQDDGIWAEVRREFGWEKSVHSPEEPFYKRTARGIKEVVSGWFQSEETPTDAQKLEEARRQFEQERQKAFRRLEGGTYGNDTGQ